MFALRLRDKAGELRKIRVTYQMVQERNSRSSARPAFAAQGDNSSAGETRCMPKG